MIINGRSTGKLSSDNIPVGKSLLKGTWAKELEQELVDLRIVHSKKYKRLAKGIERFLAGEAMDPGTVLALIAATVEMEQLPINGLVDKARTKLLEMWQQMDLISGKEIWDRET